MLKKMRIDIDKVDNDLIDDLIAHCESKMGAGYKKAKPEPEVEENTEDEVEEEPSKEKEEMTEEEMMQLVEMYNKLRK